MVLVGELLKVVNDAMNIIYSIRFCLPFGGWVSFPLFREETEQALPEGNEVGRCNRSDFSNMLLTGSGKGFYI